MKKEFTTFQYIVALIVWRFSRPKYKGKYYFIKGRKRKVIAETFSEVYFQGLKSSFPKLYLETLKKPGK